MPCTIDIAEIGAMLGHPARAAMLDALMDGRAMTAKELAYVARIAPPTASEHLRQLTEAQLLVVLKQGRHRYFRIASPLVAQMLESVSAVAAIQTPPRHRPRSRADDQVSEMRMCYDHFAGRQAVALADKLTEQRLIVLDAEGGEMTEEGFRYFRRLGVPLLESTKTRRAFCRPCLDWTERRFHIGGYVGAALARHALDCGWVRRRRDTRAVVVTAEGEAKLFSPLGLHRDVETEAA